MSNEAAERLRTYMRQLGAGSPLPLLDDALAAERRATVERIAEDVAKAIGGFLWLANNLENVNSPQFVGMFRAAAEDARPIYDKYRAILDEEAAR